MHFLRRSVFHPWSQFVMWVSVPKDLIDAVLCRLRKDLAAFLGLELPSLPGLPNSVEEEQEKRKERRKNLAAYLGVEENVLSTILPPPPPPPPSTLRQPVKMHFTPHNSDPHVSCKAPLTHTPNGWNINNIPPHTLNDLPPPLDQLTSPKWEVDSAFSSSSTASSLSSSSYSTIYIWNALSNLSIIKMQRFIGNILSHIMLTISAVHTIYWEVALDSSCICCTVINTTLMRPLKSYRNLAINLYFVSILRCYTFRT